MTGCYARNCRNTSGKGVKMNFFPKNPERRAAWLRHCQKYDALPDKLPNEHSALCEYHFEPCMWEQPRSDGKKKLKPNGLPTIFGDSVMQVENKIVDVPTNSGRLKTIMICTNKGPKNKKRTAPSPENYKILLVANQGSAAKKPKITDNFVRDPKLKENEQLASIAKRNTNLLLNSNVITYCIKDESPEVSNQIVSTNHSNPSAVEVNYGEVKFLPEFVDQDENIQVERNESDNDETDSFINENFEPLTDDELDSKEDNKVEFEPVRVEEIDSSDVDDEPVEGHREHDPISLEERELQYLESELATASDNNEGECSKCQKWEKFCLKSERIRALMKRNYRRVNRRLRAKIKQLENETIQLEGTQLNAFKIFNEDQIECMSGRKVAKWCNDTIEKATIYKNAFGTAGYCLLLEHGWPLPSLRTLRHKQEDMKKNMLANQFYEVGHE